MKSNANSTDASRPARCLIFNCTGADTRMFDREIVAACDNGGVLPEELADLFELVRLPPGSACEWRLGWK